MTTVSPTQQREDERRALKLAAIDEQIRAGSLTVRRASPKELEALRAASRRKAQLPPVPAPAAAPIRD